MTGRICRAKRCDRTDAHPPHIGQGKYLRDGGFGPRCRAKTCGQRGPHPPHIRCGMRDDAPAIRHPTSTATDGLVVNAKGTGGPIGVSDLTGFELNLLAAQTAAHEAGCEFVRHANRVRLYGGEVPTEVRERWETARDEYQRLRAA